jgi:hypothetical protein
VRSERGESERGESERGESERGESERGESERGENERESERRRRRGWRKHYQKVSRERSFASGKAANISSPKSGIPFISE